MRRIAGPILAAGALLLVTAVPSALAFAGGPLPADTSAMALVLPATQDGTAVMSHHHHHHHHHHHS